MRRWDRAIIQQSGEVSAFVANFLANPKRACVLIIGAGFDPRTLSLPALLGGASANFQVLCLREERPKSQPKLRPRANEHEQALRAIFPRCEVRSVQILSNEGTVNGGRTVIPIVDGFVNTAVRQAPVTDVIVDISALSVGIFFPIIRHLLARIEASRVDWNLHLFVAENPHVDYRIRSEAIDTASLIHGYRGDESLSQSNEHAFLWIPVFASDNTAQMSRIHAYLAQNGPPIDVSPIVAFPCSDPRSPDALIEEYRDLLNSWEVDPRHILFAAESDPLDSYRSICEITEAREQTYRELGGSSTVVSPLGSKMLSVGLMLAAIELNLKVPYVESLGFDETDVPSVPSGASHFPLTHVWLHGATYSGLW